LAVTLEPRSDCFVSDHGGFLVAALGGIGHKSAAASHVVHVPVGVDEAMQGFVCPTTQGGYYGGARLHAAGVNANQAFLGFTYPTVRERFHYCQAVIYFDEFFGDSVVRRLSSS
jgi:hypothetical protein